MLSKDRCKTTAGFFVIPLLSQLWEDKNYYERRNELSSWRPVALPNRHIHLYLFKLGYDVPALLSSVMYIFSGKNITAMFTISRRRWDQNTTQVANRLERARATYVRLLHLPPWLQCSGQLIWRNTPILARPMSYRNFQHFMENFRVLLNSLNSGSLYLCHQAPHQKTIQNQIKPSPLHRYRWSAPDKNLPLTSL
jgi:hypothetical protein